MFSTDKILADIEKWIKELDFDRAPHGLYEPIEYTLALGGKRIRPVLCLATCALFSDDYERAKWAALAIEVFHNFTLLHDDVMDNAGIRRGKPTVVVRNGLNTAILSGDAMLIEAYKLLQLTDTPAFSLITDTFNQTATEVCEGQQLDMDYEKTFNVSSTDYINMIRLKTAVLLAASIKIGALAGGATGPETQALYDYGILLGLAFQLQDDLLDTFGDELTFGKNIGGDIMSNKKTFLLISALENANSQQRRELMQWIEHPDPIREEKINAVKAIYEQTGVKQATEQKIQSLYDKAMAQLRAMEISAEGKRFFIDFADKLFKRAK